MEKEIIKVGQMDNTMDNTFESANRVCGRNGLCPTIPTCCGGNIQPKCLRKFRNVVAMRGRKRCGDDYSQNLESREDGITNTITTVLKDNLVIAKVVQNGRL